MHPFHLNSGKIKPYFLLIKKHKYTIALVCACMLLPILLQIGHAIQAADPNVNLSSPYNTVHTHFMLLSPGNESFKKAGIVFIHLKGSSEKQKQKMAIKLKRLLTLKGINVDTIPQDPNYIDPTVNEHRYILSKKLPQVYLIKHGKEWHYSEDTWHFINQYEKLFKLNTLFYPFLSKEFCKKQIFNLAIWQYIVLIGVVIMIWLTHKIMPYFFKFVIQKLTGHSHRKQFAMERLLLALITISFLKMVLTMLQLQYLESFMNRVLEAAICFVWMCLAYECIDIVQNRIKIAKQHNKFMIHVLPLCSMVAKIIIVLVGLVETIDNLGFATEFLVKALSFSTLGLGLASQDTIKNLFGSLMIMMDRPFSIGDEIVSGAIRGKVEEIGLRATLLRTKEGSLVYIPNAKLADAYIDNFGRRNLRMISLEVPLSYSIPLELLPSFVKGLREIAQCQPFVKSEQTTMYLDKMSDNGFVIIFNLYLDATESKLEQECKNTVIPLILKLAHQLGLRLGKVQHITSIIAPTRSAASPSFPLKNNND